MEYFVTFELAKKLKEKGFPQKCFGKYDMMGPTYTEDGQLYVNGCITETDTACSVPTISEVLKWLREEKKIHIGPCVLVDIDNDADDKIITYYTYWSFSIISIESGDMIYCEYEHVDDKRFDSYEQAAIAGIKNILDKLA